MPTKPETSEIKFTIHLDEQKLPERIEWHATEAGFTGGRDCKGIMISLFDKTEKSTFKIDLWTKEMEVPEMSRFFAETFISMADTYFKATGDEEMTEGIRTFAKSFAERSGFAEKG